MFNTMKTLLLDNSGQGLAEYSLILLFVALAVPWPLKQQEKNSRNARFHNQQLAQLKKKLPRGCFMVNISLNGE